MTGREEYSVVVWYPDDSYEYVSRWVGGREAVEMAKRLTESVGGRSGLIAKVAVTDGADDTNFLWEYGKGIVFPTLEELRRK
jgi:hypothetical protein